ELPYRSTVETEVWTQLKDGSVRIEQTIFVERESQRKILLGKEGRTIRAIGAEARRESAEAIEAPVNLFLFVKVREGWGDDPARYREIGLEMPERSIAFDAGKAHGRDRQRHRARRASARRGERDRGAHDARARPAPRRRSRRRRLAHAARAAARQFGPGGMASAARRAPRAFLDRGARAARGVLPAG